MRDDSSFLRPIITLTSDFGLDDFYVAEMKAVLLAGCRDARLIDVTHAVPRHDPLAGSIVLERAISVFPEGTVHVAVVDPGVGTSRRLLIARTRRQRIICPDNGLITWTQRRHGLDEVHELLWRPDAPSRTFHGRDIMAPAAAMIASGTAIEAIARSVNDPVLLPVRLAEVGAAVATVIHIDRFGNAMTNCPADHLHPPPRAFVVKGHDMGELRRTYDDVRPGEALALIGSGGLLEIAVREGSAAERLGVRVGDMVEIRS